MNNLIPLVNKLQDVFNTIGSETVDLPQIIVVGSQSSGKSSVLENIVQRDFLPRGCGIVTRRPLVLQLVNSPPPDDIEADSKAAEEYGVFLHEPSQNFTDFTEIRKEIEAETVRVAGQNKGISRSPIHLKIYSPKVLNLTLVDLPGIILAVSPANVDLVNSESLKLAKQVDPEGRRTIGVLTKLDLMDAGTNALDILTGRVFPLKLGFIGVVNRSQQDIIGNKPMSDALKSEAIFFKNHPAYRNIATRLGTSFLTKTLNNILMNHIRERLPDIKAHINALIGQTTQELMTYGDPALDGKSNKGALILKHLTKFATDFVTSIDGTTSHISTKELIYGAALETINPCGNLSVQDIRTAIRNSTGPRPSLFVPEIAFDLLVKPQIQLLEQPSLRCVELVYEELSKICHNCGGSELFRYPRLHSKIIEVLSDLLRERLTPTSAYVESLISIQRAYINTNHPDFIGGGGGSLLNNNNSSSSINNLKDDGPDGSSSHFENNGINSGKDHNNMMGHHLQNGVGGSSGGNHQTWAQREFFLTYFFGSGNKNDRTALPDQPLSSTKNGTFAKSSIDIIELEKKFEGIALDDHNNLSEREELETQLIRSLISSYFNIVRKTIRDTVPKAIMHLLVNHSREEVQNRLVSELYKDDLFDELLQEDENLASERQKCKTMLEVYRKAFEIINEAM
ncbi:24051_t:CDS:2 [Entrophospora sp. SA101]|nr:13737_t:CDS:2 [Entrophospora sp. SA101]CAJ0765560.1 24051_t:CDS:2 [Entrophospora sp. SA101]CAJ0825464.1 12182_t:CDS:2 [Entrophospora sp. SA101]CAJ0918928.1 16346_t:CDS:2 [Entrophospora sp. SA101]CAJ0918933.1 16349_t:CDS:2 [Entrophospora sp. SA101]